MSTGFRGTEWGDNSEAKGWLLYIVIVKSANEIRDYRFE